MSFWSYAAPLRPVLSMLDFCAVYFSTLLGRCALLSLPLLGLALLLRRAGAGNVFSRGAAWAVMVPAPFLGKLAVFYRWELYQNCRVLLPLVQWQSWCCGFWWVRYAYLLGAAISAAVMVRRRCRLQRMIRGLPTACLDNQKVRLCALPVSPFTAGVLCPHIVVPRAAWEQMDKDELRTVFLHEQTHIRLGHLWMFLFWDILCALLWINPLLRPAGRLMKEDMEQICDAVTIRRSGQAPAAYGHVILKSLRLLRTPADGLPAAFAGETEFDSAKRRLRRVRDYRPYSRRGAGALAGVVALALLMVLAAVHQASLPRSTELEGFQIVHVTEDVVFSTLYESDTNEGFPVRLSGNQAEVDLAAFRALLPENPPEDGWYYILWGGFLKLPGIGGGLNSIYVDGWADGAVAAAEFEDINEEFYVKLAKWI